MTFGFGELALAAGLVWLPVAPGVWHAEARMADHGALSVVRVVALRLDPARVRFALDTATRDLGTRGAWTVDRMPRDAVAAFNTGQFIGGVAWGWLVRDGIELGAPGTGPLAMALVVDSAGGPALLTPGEVPRARGHVRLAIQSYPALLVGDGELPWNLRAAGRGVDLGHHDSRLALGILKDGSIVVVLTRFAGIGAGANGETMPWGPTVVEMAAFMRALGCHKAMLLDGGISSQMAFRVRDGSVRRWTNWRKVPVGVVVKPRTNQ